MERLLARLERRFGRLAIEHLTLLIVGGAVAVFILEKLRPGFSDYLALDLPLVLHGQVWRLVTYLFIPQDTGMFWFFTLYFFWMMGTSLENEWGAFKYNIFYFVAMIGTTVAAAVTGAPVGNLSINASVILAFATLFPDFEFYLFFVIRLKAKWLGYLAAAFILYQLITSDWAMRFAIIAALANYFLFFGADLVHTIRGGARRARQSERRTSLRPPEPVVQARVCSICGARESDGADIRVCSCAKCGGPRTLCLEHARNH